MPRGCVTTSKSTKQSITEKKTWASLYVVPHYNFTLQELMGESIHIPIEWGREEFSCEVHSSCFATSDKCWWTVKKMEQLVGEWHCFWKKRGKIFDMRIMFFYFFFFFPQGWLYRRVHRRWMYASEPNSAYLLCTYPTSPTRGIVTAR